jgi:hypothetical protein
MILVLVGDLEIDDVREGQRSDDSTPKPGAEDPF